MVDLPKPAGMASTPSPFPGPDPAQEAWERSTPSPEPNIGHRLVYEYLIYNCYSETAKAFGDFHTSSNPSQNRSARKGKGRQTRDFSTALDRSGGATAMDIDDGMGGNGIDSEGDCTMYDNDASSRPFSSTLGGTVGIGGLGGDASGSCNSGPLRTLEQRKHLQELVIEGQTQEALKFCHRVFPEALTPDNEANTVMLFQLRCQHFIECARKDSMEALQYAQTEMNRPEYHTEPFKSRFTDIMALIAYPNPETSPVASYLSQDRREEVASNLNSHILSLYGLPTRPAIDSVVRQAVVVRELLSSEKETKSKVCIWRYGFKSHIDAPTSRHLAEPV
ncbi:Ran-binding protein 9 [Rhizophlyctis rosea]|uniref:Ran-binding protein 9 n=1 Tax=Rhizophlyctis rosea TaxID=64517 RepID=A0AAD5SH10_9FUNG|nr:Ran-binding protein 9 [Rhizophlyctis rosea]